MRDLTAPLSQYRYSSITSPIWLDDLDCSIANSNRRAYACSHAGIGINNCDHSQDVILSCEVGKYSTTQIIFAKQK